MKKKESKYPTSQELARWERANKHKFPKEKFFARRHATIYLGKTGLHKRAHKFGISQISSRSARRVPLI